MLKIFPLAEKQIFYPILAYWSYTSWYMGRKVPFNAVLNEYRRRADMESMPYSFIALWDDIPAGMVSLKENDLSSRLELGPWLSALYVAPEFRKRGIAERLITEIKKQCSSIAVPRVFLFIDNKNMDYLEKYYRNKNWIFLEDSLDSDGHETKIFFLET